MLAADLLLLEGRPAACTAGLLAVSLAAVCLTFANAFSGSEAPPFPPQPCTNDSAALAAMHLVYSDEPSRDQFGPWLHGIFSRAFDATRIVESVANFSAAEPPPARGAVTVLVCNEWFEGTRLSTPSPCFARAMQLAATPRFCLVHICDEKPDGLRFRALYSSLRCVIRHYYHPRYAPLSTYVPLGVIGRPVSAPCGARPGRRCAERALQCKSGFSGGEDSDASPKRAIRRAMRVALAKSRRCSFGALSHDDTARTCLMPAPLGNDPESFRFWEALDAGAVPLTVRPSTVHWGFDFFDLVPGNPWSLSFDSEASLLEFAEFVLRQNMTDALQAYARDWYCRQMTAVSDAVRGEFRRLRCGARARRVPRGTTFRASLG